MSGDLERRLAFAVELAHRAGALVLEHFRTPDLAIEEKGDGTPVTVADRAAERFLRERIEAAYPDDGILGEEEGESEGASGCTWILDPIDGTESFRRGLPLFGTLIGLEQDGEATLGVIHMAAAGELVEGARGLGARWHVGGAVREARVSRIATLAESTFGTTGASIFDLAGRADFFRRVLDATRRDRGGLDCYAHLLVATGRMEFALDPLMHVWDNAALKPIVEEAGGRFTCFAGEPTIRGGSALSSNGLVHDALLELARE